MSVLNHVIKLRTPVTVKHNENVTVPLDIQLQILQEAKICLIQGSVRVCELSGRSAKYASDDTSIKNGEVGLCYCIIDAALKFKGKFGITAWHNARHIISVFNLENAIKFGKAKVGHSYWWEETLPYKNKPRRNVKPRLMFLDWCIRQTKKDMEKERKLLNSYLNGNKQFQ